MTPSSIGLLLVVTFLFWRLFRVIGKEERTQTTVNILPSTQEAASLKNKSQRELTEGEIALLGKMVFFKVSSSFANGDIKALQELLTADVFEAFKKQIEDRQGKKNILDFMLICFSSVKVLQRDKEKNSFLMEFVTEQVNVLKDSAGKVLEGDPMTVQSIKDIWSFKFSDKGTFVVAATKSEAFHA